MTVPTEQSDQTYVGNNFEDTFGTVFPYLLAAHLRVRFTPIATGIEQLLVLGVDYVVPDHTEPSDDNLITTFIPDIGDLLVIEHSIPFTQPVSFRTQGEFSPATHEEALDAAAIRDQELLRRVKALETVGGAGSVAAGLGLSFTGDTMNVNAGTGLEFSGDNLAVRAADTAPLPILKQTAAIGSSRFAYQDHKHDVTTAAAVELTDSTNAEGAATSLARSNHTHAHGNRGGGSLHAVATAIDDGFMSYVDYQLLRSVLYPRYKMELHEDSTTAGAVAGDSVYVGDDIPYDPTSHFESSRSLECVATGYATDGTVYSVSAAYCVKIDAAGTSSQVGATKVLYEHNGTVAANLALVIDGAFTGSNYFASVHVVGVAAKTIKWHLTVRQFVQFS